MEELHVCSKKAEYKKECVLIDPSYHVLEPRQPVTEALRELSLQKMY